MLTKNFYVAISAFIAGEQRTTATVTDITGATVPVHGRYSESSSNYYPIINIMNVWNTDKSELSLYGVYLSEDDSEPSLSDFTITPIKLTASSVSCTKGFNQYEGYSEFTSSALIKNSIGESKTIRSICLVGQCFEPTNTSSPATRYVLFDHTKLETPITIAANETKTITYTIRINYPV